MYIHIELQCNAAVKSKEGYST